MAGMFYSLKEAAAKLNKTEQEVKELAKQGQLREFRDGSNLLFKIDEVEALMSDTSITASPEASPSLEQPTESAEVTEPELIPEPEVAEAPVQPIEPEEEAKEEEEIALASESGIAAAEGDLTSADTALTSEGINVLSKTDHDFQLTDDTMAETTIAPGTGGTSGITGTTGEASLEEIEEDVSLDSFGSGSGLLDLSLQADDTSLGGILDEIYTTEGGEGQEPGEPASAVEMVAEAESAVGGLSEEELAGPPAVSIVPEMPTIAQPYIEAPPDALGNSLGVMLSLPLLALVYAAIVTIAGLKNVMPTILDKIQTPYLALYIMAGLSVAAILTFGTTFTLSGGLGTGGTKKKKAKKPKKAKKAAPEEETAI